jgi:hypothetical protein
MFQPNNDIRIGNNGIFHLSNDILNCKYDRFMSNNDACCLRNETGYACNDICICNIDIFWINILDVGLPARQTRRDRNPSSK